MHSFSYIKCSSLFFKMGGCFSFAVFCVFWEESLIFQKMSKMCSYQKLYLNICVSSLCKNPTKIILVVIIRSDIVCLNWKEKNEVYLLCKTILSVGYLKDSCCSCSSSYYKLCKYEFDWLIVCAIVDNIPDNLGVCRFFFKMRSLWIRKKGWVIKNFV